MAKRSANQTVIDPANEVADPAEALLEGTEEQELIDQAREPIDQSVMDQAAQKAADNVTGTGDAFIEIFNLQLPKFVGQIDAQKQGYVSRRIDCELTDEIGQAFVRHSLGLRMSHATYFWRGQWLHVDKPVDVIRWMFSDPDKRTIAGGAEPTEEVKEPA